MQLKNTQAQAVKNIGNKLLVICGPTATGKTKLALFLARKFNGELISADSRQIYKGLDIGTGKDIPEKSKIQMTNDKLGFYLLNGIKVWGYDLVSAREEFSVSKYLEIAGKIIDDILVRGKLPILVGGTGLYIKGVIEGISTSVIPKSLDLRRKYEDKTVRELQTILGELDINKLNSMNESDRNNPRRLIRSIEVNKFKGKFIYKSNTSKNYNTLLIGLTAPKEIMVHRIKERVSHRIRHGFFSEINMLLESGVGWNDQSMNALGYKHYKKYLSSEWDMEYFKQKWAADEYKYSKRQMVWFKKNKDVIWFDISAQDYQSKVEKTVARWYSYR